VKAGVKYDVRKSSHDALSHRRPMCGRQLRFYLIAVRKVGI
jgi:hypothetical protein